jgi:hypothetical protein
MLHHIDILQTRYQRLISLIITQSLISPSVYSQGPSQSQATYTFLTLLPGFHQSHRHLTPLTIHHPNIRTPGSCLEPLQLHPSTECRTSVPRLSRISAQCTASDRLPALHAASHGHYANTQSTPHLSHHHPILFSALQSTSRAPMTQSQAFNPFVYSQGPHISNQSPNSLLPEPSHQRLLTLQPAQSPPTQLHRPQSHLYSPTSPSVNSQGAAE